MYTDLKEIKLYLLREDMIICVENLKEPKKKNPPGTNTQLYSKV